MRDYLFGLWGWGLFAVSAAGQCEPHWLWTLGSGTDGPIFALAEWRGELVAGGEFLHAGGVEATRVARWDGAQWHALGDGVDGTVYAACEFAGDLIVAGNLTTAGGVKANSIARWDGSAWQPLGDGLNGSISPGAQMVTAIATHDSNLFAVGAFDTAGGEEALYGARWDGQSWHDAPLREQKTSAFSYFHLRSVAGSLFAGGGIWGGVFKWGNNGWIPLGPNNLATFITIPVAIDGKLGAVWSVPDNNLISKGLFLYKNGDWSKVASYGSGGSKTVMVATAAASFAGDLYIANTYPIYPPGQYSVRFRAGFYAMGTGLVPSGQSPIVAGDMLPYRGRLVVAGAFTAAGDVPANNIAVWGCDCPPDCDASGALDVDDFLCFQSLFALGDYAADCDNSTVLDIDDFLCFQTLFAVGC